MRPQHLNEIQQLVVDGDLDALKSRFREPNRFSIETVRLALDGQHEGVMRFVMDHAIESAWLQAVSLIETAVRNVKATAVKVLLDYPQCTRLTDEQAPPLHILNRWDDPERGGHSQAEMTNVVKMIVDSGRFGLHDIFRLDHGTPMSFALRAAHPSACIALTEAGALDTCSDAGLFNTVAAALKWESADRRYRFVNYMLHHPSFGDRLKNHRDGELNSLMHIAAKFKKMHLVRDMCDIGYDPFDRNLSGQDMREVARMASYGDEEVMSIAQACCGIKILKRVSAAARRP